MNKATSQEKARAAGVSKKAAEAIIEASKLFKIYTTQKGGQLTALEDVNISIEENEFITLVGPSGCGKSTFLKMVAALIGPSKGSIQLKGRDIVAPSRDVGIVFQDPVLLPWRNVLENVMLPIEILGLSRNDYLAKARDLIELVGLHDFEQSMPNELSGGMQQRAALCRALVHDPSILLMDEPFAALDAMTREELGFELMRLWEKHRKTILFVTHSIPEAILLADRVVVMTPRPGRIAKIIEIALGRPRTLDMEFSQQFKSYSNVIRKLIFSGQDR